MFDLEQAIADWLQQLRDAGIKSSASLDELESHLRADVERQARAGVSGQQAFATAVQCLGQPTALQNEFSKSGGTIPELIKHIVLTLFGVPKPQFASNMNPSYSNIEPGWATYLKAAVSVAPAMWLLGFAMVKCVPGIKVSFERAGGVLLPEWSKFGLGIAELIRDHLFHLVVAGVLALVLLEWRARKWPRYRRAAVGLAAFTLNFSFLSLLFLIIVTAAFVASSVARMASHAAN